MIYTCALSLLLLQPNDAGAETLNKETALQRVLQNNPTYMAVLADIDAADGNRQQASLPLNPDAIFEVENFAGTDELSGFDGADITLGIEQTIEMGGKRKNRKDIANLTYKITQQQAKAQALSLLAETDYAFARVAIAQERINLANKRLSLANKTHSIVKKRVSAAKSADIQHTKADIEQAAAEVAKRKAEKDVITAKNDLARILDITDTSNLDVNFDLSALPSLVDRQALLETLQNTAQYKALEFSKLQSQSSLDLAKSEATPNPTIGLGVRRFNGNDSTALVAGLSFPLPVFNRNQGGIKEAKANMLKADAERHASRLSLRQSAIQSWEDLATSLDEAKRYQDEIIPSAHKAYEQAEYGYSRGAFGFLDLLDAQRVLYEVQEARLDSLLNVYEAKAQTDFLMETHKHLIENFSQTNLKGQTNE